VDAATVLRAARERGRVSRRGLARRAGTSAATLAAYESGRVTPSVATLVRIVRAAGFEIEAGLLPRARPGDADARGRELLDALDLAAQLPARHAPSIEYPRFGVA